MSPSAASQSFGADCVTFSGELGELSAARGLEIGQRQFYAWMTFGQFNCCCRSMATFQVAFTNRAAGSAELLWPFKHFLQRRF